MEELTTLASLLESIQSSDDKVRAAARDRAGVVGAQAVAPLTKIAATDEQNIARAANRAIQNIVYYCGRPGADAEAKAVASELVEQLDQPHPVQLRRDLIWMTWQIADESAVPPLAALLTHSDLSEDARMALERLPGDSASKALQTAFDKAPEKDRSALAHSLMARGVETPEVADLRLKPVRPTSVKPVSK